LPSFIERSSPSGDGLQKRIFALCYALSRVTSGTNLLAFETRVGWVVRGWVGLKITGAFDLGWNGNDYAERLALAAVSAATVTATATVSNAGMSAAVRTAGGSTRRRSARLTAAAAAETTGAGHA